jgi:hydrogenase maturation protease
VLPTFHIGHGGSVHRSALQEFSGGSEFEAIRGEDGRTAALIVRTKQAIAAEVDVHVQSVQDGLFKITALVANRSQATESISASRDAALMHSLLSAHTVLGVDGGEFVSLLDPPAPLKEIASACQNLGTWPVLVGEEGERDAMLSSPIILYDYPQIAPESPGNLFDGTEIDEILALRILTLTDDEKREMQHADARSRQILERTEALPAEHFMKLHGVLRGLRPASEEKP